MLSQARQQQLVNFDESWAQAKLKIEDNRAVIKRQDKLIVDLTQKNDVCAIKKAETIDQIQKQQREQTSL